MLELEMSMDTPNSPKKYLYNFFFLKKYILVMILIYEHPYFKCVDPSLSLLSNNNIRLALIFNHRKTH